MLFVDASHKDVEVHRGGGISLSQTVNGHVSVCRGTIRIVSIVPLWGDCFAVEGTEGFQQVVVDDVTLELLLDFVSGAEGVRAPEVEVDLDEGRMDLEGQGAA